jgi:hypothetical protein
VGDPGRRREPPVSLDERRNSTQEISRKCGSGQNAICSAAHSPPTASSKPAPPLAAPHHCWLRCWSGAVGPAPTPAAAKACAAAPSSPPSRREFPVHLAQNDFLDFC